MKKLHNLTCIDAVLSVYEDHLEINRDGSIEQILIGDIESAAYSSNTIAIYYNANKANLDVLEEKAALAARVVNTINRLSNGEYIEPHPAPNKKGNAIRKISIAVIIISALIVGVLSIMPDSSLITLSEFNAIQNGMTYEQVCEIVGGPGELLSDVDLGIGSEYAGQVYMWEGNGSLGANANITFQGGVVVMKAQYGLK